MIIDIHVHCYPDEVAARSISARSQKFGITPVTDGTLQGLKQSMSRAGVNISVLQPIALKPEQSTPSRLRKVLDTFSGTVMIAAHMGGYRYWDDVEKHLLGKNIYFDTAYSIHELGKERAEKFIKQHGTDRVLFGTDSPWRDHAMDISLIKSLNLDQEDIKGILGNNAKKLLGFGE